MAIVLMIAAVIFWLVIQYQMAKHGVQPRSRGSLRYQRRKANKLGVDPLDVPIRPRGGEYTGSPEPFSPPPGRPWERDPDYKIKDVNYRPWKTLFWVAFVIIVLMFFIPTKH